MKTYFSPEEIVLISGGFMTTAISLIFYFRSREKWAVSFLWISAICWYVLAAELDLFFHGWDERFHALVSQNLSEDFLKPALYTDPVLSEYDYRDWVRAKIWLHKQPLFLWISAISIKLLGFSEFSYRLPHALLCAGIVPLIWRMGRIMHINSTGYWGALFTLYSPWLFGLISGRNQLDQNDAAFFVCVAFSFWSFSEYINKPGLRWAILTGLFAGAAVLTKWLPGLVVYIAWMYCLLVSERPLRVRMFKHVLLSVVVCLLTILPWQVYILITYPAEAMQEYAHAHKHFQEVVENHREAVSYYASENLTRLYGWLGHMFFIPGLILFARNSRKRILVRAILFTTVFVYLFFTYSTTKMPSFVFMMSVPVFLGFGACISWLEVRLKKSNWYSWLVLAVILPVVYFSRDPEEIQSVYKRFDISRPYNRALRYNRNAYILARREIPKQSVLFNFPGWEYVNAMIYTGAPAYSQVPSPEEISELKLKGRRVVVFSGNDPLPQYLTQDSSVLILPWRIQGGY